jgi:hypothetical protein
MRFSASFLLVLRRFRCRAADPVSAGVSTRSVAPARCTVEAKWRVGRGVGCGRGHPRFLREAPMPPERPRGQPSPIPAARSRELSRRTKGGGNAPSGGRTGAPASATARQAPEKTRGRWRHRQGAARTRRERCLRKIPRYSPLRELATARRQVFPCDGPAARPVGKVQRVHGGKGVCERCRDTHRCGSLRRHGGGLARATDPQRGLQPDLR